MCKTNFKGAHKLSETIGYSKNIIESKKKRFFVKEVKYKVIPGTIKIADSV
jgi:hypothetical protein